MICELVLGEKTSVEHSHPVASSSDICLTDGIHLTDETEILRQGR